MAKDSEKSHKLDETLMLSDECLDNRHRLPFEDKEERPGVYRRINPEEFLGLEKEEPLTGPAKYIGQEDVVEAMREGLSMGPGYNIMVIDEERSFDFAKSVVSDYCTDREVKNVDQIAFHNFEDDYMIETGAVPAGIGDKIKKDLENLLKEVEKATKSPSDEKYSLLQEKIRDISKGAAENYSEIEAKYRDEFDKGLAEIGLREQDGKFYGSKSQTGISEADQKKAEEIQTAYQKDLNDASQKYVDSLELYLLKEQDDGTIVKTGDRELKLFDERHVESRREYRDKDKVKAKQKCRKALEKNNLKLEEGVLAYIDPERVTDKDILDSAKDMKLEYGKKLKELTLKKASEVKSGMTEATKEMIAEEVGERLDALIAKYGDSENYRGCETIVRMLSSIKKFVIKDPDTMHKSKKDSLADFFLGGPDKKLYTVRVFVNNKDNPKKMIHEEVIAPFPVEETFGMIAYDHKKAHQKVKAGAFAKANKGVITINGYDMALLFSNQILVEKLLSAIEGKEVKVGLRDMAGLEAKCETDAKVVLCVGNIASKVLGHPYHGRLMKHFKKQIILNDKMENTLENRVKMARFLHTAIHDYNESVDASTGCNKLSPEAVAKIIEFQLMEYGKDKLPLRNMDFFEDIAIRAGTLAARDGEIPTSPENVERAYDSIRRERMGKIDRIIEDMERKVHYPEEPQVGLSNGLSFGSTTFGTLGRTMKIAVEAIPNGSGSIKFDNIKKLAKKSGGDWDDSIEQVETMIRKKFDRPEEPLCFDFRISAPEHYGRVDGPSAGMAIYVACISAMTGIPVQPNVFYTGTLESKLDRAGMIGGIPEKSMAPFRRLIKTGKKVILAAPEMNTDDRQIVDPEMQEEVREGKYKNYSYDTADEALEIGLRFPAEYIEEVGLKVIEETNKRFKKKKKGILGFLRKKK